jgi:hypothetical protein
MRFEPSPAFAGLGTATRLAAVPTGDRQLAGAGITLVSDQEDKAFQKFLARRGVNLSAVDRISGLDCLAGGGLVILIPCDSEPR